MKPSLSKSKTAQPGPVASAMLLRSKSPRLCLNLMPAASVMSVNCRPAGIGAEDRQGESQHQRDAGRWPSRGFPGAGRRKDEGMVIMGPPLGCRDSDVAGRIELGAQVNPLNDRSQGLRAQGRAFAGWRHGVHLPVGCGSVGLVAVIPGARGVAAGELPDEPARAGAPGIHVPAGPGPRSRAVGLAVPRGQQGVVSLFATRRLRAVPP